MKVQKDTINTLCPRTNRDEDERSGMEPRRVSKGGTNKGENDRWSSRRAVRPRPQEPKQRSLRNSILYTDVKSLPFSTVTHHLLLVDTQERLPIVRERMTPSPLRSTTITSTPYGFLFSYLPHLYYNPYPIEHRPSPVDTSQTTGSLPPVFLSPGV